MTAEEILRGLIKDLNEAGAPFSDHTLVCRNGCPLCVLMDHVLDLADDAEGDLDRLKLGIVRAA